MGKHHLLTLLLTGILATTTVTAQTPAIVLDKDGGSFPVISPGYLLDPENTLTPDRALTATFTPSPKKVPVFPMQKGVVWLRIILQNKSPRSQWLFNIDNGFLAIADLFHKDTAQRWQRFSTGTKNPQANIRFTPMFSFPLAIPQDRPDTIYLRIASNSNIRVPMTIADNAATTEYANTRSLFDGLYFGFIIAFLVYNSFLLIKFRDRIYIYYMLYIFFFALNIGFARGYTSAYLFARENSINNTNTFAVLATVFSMLFTTRFLYTRESAKIVQGLAWVIYSFCIVIMLLTFQGKYIPAFFILWILNGLDIIYLFSIGIWLYRKGFTPSIFYLVGFGILLTGIVIYALKDLGTLPSNLLTDSAMNIASVFEISTLSYALVVKFNFYKRQNERIRQLAAKQAAVFSQQLMQSQEAERKRIAGELHDSIGQSMILLKNKLLLLKRRSGKDAGPELSAAAELAGATIQDIRSAAYALHPFQLDLFGLTQSLSMLAREVGENANIRLAATIDKIDGLFDKTAELAIYRIVQELLTNIVKHAAATEASVEIKKQPTLIELRIADNGKGLSAETDITVIPRGGLGLRSINERLIPLNGILRHSANQPNGAVFTIRIPL